MVTPIAGAGTGEDRWRAWQSMRDWPGLALTPPGTPLVVAAHPDDEVLAVGGLLAMLGSAELVAVTDGEASHPDSTVYAPAALAALRRAETTEALLVLGLATATVHRLGEPDGKIDQDIVYGALAGLLSPGRWCLATWRHDGHPDHEAVGRAAASACADTGAVLLEYPIWAWHWSAPDDPRVPWGRARRIDLDDASRTAKAAAITAYRSQILPLGPDPADAAILPPHILARFARSFETVLV